MTVRRRRWRRFAVGAVSACALAALGGAGTFALLRAYAPVPVPDRSVEVVDRAGRLLRPFALNDGRWRLAADPMAIDRRFVDMLIAYEDHHFRSHWGVDPLALARATLQFIVHRRIISGGSTITMQVARLLEQPSERTIAAKLSEMWRALALEARLSKDEILALYLTLAPYGGNLEGMRAASLAYFGKEPRKVTLAEAALLVALPQSPETRRPDRAAESARRARDRVLTRMVAHGGVDRAEADHARLDAVPVVRRPMPMFAPHAAAAALAAEPERKLHKLTIDRPNQERLESLVVERAQALGPGLSVAIVMVDNATGEVLARVGSADFHDPARAGQVDMTRAVRSPGSTLKPFIYGVAFEDGIAHPDTLIEDRPVRFGTYAPENFDLSFQGTVTVKHALQLSLNVPAVALLEAVGPQRLAARLAATGARLDLPPGEIPGLAIGLGGVGLRLDDLAMLYSALARHGEARPLKTRMDEPASSLPIRTRLFESFAAWYVAQALLGTPPPEHAAGGRIAFKTGTAYGYRDAWAVGFDGRHTIAVWVGRPDGQPVPGLVGRSAAAPILFEAFARVSPKPTPLPPPPAGVIAGPTPKLPPPLQRFARAGIEAEALRIVFPPNGAQLALEGEPAPITVKTTGGVAPFTLLVDGLPTATSRARRSLLLRPREPGFARITVIDARGASDSITVRLP